MINNFNSLFPIYLPDATLGVVRSLDSQDLQNCGIKGIVVNTFHLMSKPGIKILNKAGGIKKLMNFRGVVISDSGGFQLLSLIYKNPRLGRVENKGVALYSGLKKQRKTYFTPEKSIQIQAAINPDIMICLDDCPKVCALRQENEISVIRTIEWAKRSKSQFSKLKLQSFKLFAVVQGGNYPDLRKKCALELIKIGFDGYCFGGWPMRNGRLNHKILKYTASLLPDNKPKYALGVGKPEDIKACFKMGYTIFDCVLPTRDARHQRLYLKKGYLYINKQKYALDFRPISQNCKCHTCRNYSRAYLHHLFKIKDPSAWRLATIHNLWIYSSIFKNRE